MNEQEKLEKAKDFINIVRKMENDELETMIQEVAGEPLAEFFLRYSYDLISRDPGRVIETCCSMMMMGYLIGRTQDGSARSVARPTQRPAQA